jgi:plasmid stabilization system protein ParE
MGKYKVKIYPTAQMDLNDIVSYLNTLSPQAAIGYYDLLVEKISSLVGMPERCPFVRNIALKAKGYRYLIVENYLVFFVVKDDTIQIRRILYNKHQYKGLL